MQKLVEGSIRTLLDDEIRSFVATALEREGMVWARGEARRLARAYAGSGLDEDQIHEAIVRAAVSAGVPAELSRRA
jgi:hypothetical protein